MELLYQLSYNGINFERTYYCFSLATGLVKAGTALFSPKALSIKEKEDLSTDLFFTMELLYQLSYNGETN